MAGKFKAKGDLVGAFFIEEATLRRIVELMRDAHVDADATVSVSAQFEENRVVEASNIDDILRDAMVRSRFITRFAVSSVSNDGYSEFYIFSYLRNAISYSISGDRSWVLALEESLRTEVSACERWWGWIRDNTKLRSTIFGFLFAAFFISLAAIPILGGNNMMLPARICFYIALSILSLYAVIKTLQFIYPAVVFNVGKGERSHRTRLKIANFLFFGIAATILLGLFVNWLSKTAGI